MHTQAHTPKKSTRKLLQIKTLDSPLNYSLPHIVVMMTTSITFTACSDGFQSSANPVREICTIQVSGTHYKVPDWF